MFFLTDGVYTIELHIFSLKLLLIHLGNDFLRQFMNIIVAFLDVGSEEQFDRISFGALCFVAHFSIQIM